MPRPLYPSPSLRSAAAWRGLRVGLFGGSFNPAHDAHLQLAEHGLKQLKLDAVWWMVSPQNPLKSTHDMGPLATRMASVQQKINDPRMVVTDIETQLGTQYTADTIRALKKHFPYTAFTWMMGADSLRTFHLWEDWRDIARLVPIAVFARPPQQLRALSGFAAQTLRKYKQPHLRIGKKQQWRYVMMPLNPISATEIRATHANTKTET